VLLQTLRSRGLTVQAFKVGLDFIDTAYHPGATGRPAVNLDLWMMGAAAGKQSFDTFSADADVRPTTRTTGAILDGMRD
jgi:cobyrinic acid a,c-diamide synthase